MELFNLRLSYCISCNKEIQDALYGNSFLPNLFTIIIGFIILALIVFGFTYFSARKYKKHLNLFPQKEILDPVPLSAASIVMGMGIGGFLDGIVFHQILQLHSMVSNRLSIDTFVGKAVNMFWDGIFHALTLITVTIGFGLLINLLKRRNINPSPKLALGGAVAGWGIFNLVEGIIHHQIIKLHNVNEYAQNPEVWNYSFLGSGILFIAAGFFLIYHRDHYPTRME